MHKLFPTSDQKWSKLIAYFRPKQLKIHTFGTAHTYVAYIRDYPHPPPGAKNALQITSLAAYASETKMASLRDESDLGLHQLTKRDSGIFSMYNLLNFDGLTVIFKGELAPRRLQNSRFGYHKIGFSRHARVPPSPLSYSPFYPCSRPFFRLLA